MNYESITESKIPIRLLLKGLPGTGKTWMASHLPNVVLFNFDNNVRGLQKLPHEVKDKVRIITPTRLTDNKLLVWDEFTKSLGQVLEDKTVETVVIDSLTLMGEHLSDTCLKSTSPKKAMQIQDWGTFGRYLKWLGDELIMATNLDKNIVIIAHETVEKDEVTKTFKHFLALGGSMKTRFDAYFSDVWQTSTSSHVTQGTQFWITTSPSSTFSAKCSMDLPQKFQFNELKDKIIEEFKL